MPQLVVKLGDLSLIGKGALKVLTTNSEDNDKKDAYRTLGAIDRAATGTRSTDAPLRVRMQRSFVVNCNFFARLDIAQSDKEYVIVEHLHEGIR